ncbi:MAG: xylulokinase [Eubacteriales bacterium]|nr:xylulokinase [Eubacteriales bacterium]MDD4323225.1 xylulokinase [Eubacteriales bacterium]MDD4541401.1 xylulokinase [Eubacteriales bacterium]
MNNNTFVGIDIGTSSAKLLLMDENGAVLDTESRSYAISYPASGWSEQNPEDWFDAIIDGLHSLLSKHKKEDVRAISFAGQMHSLVTLDDNDGVIRPAILWNDLRTTEETNFLNYEIGEATLVQETGNIAFAGFTAPKLLWMKKHEPDLFSKIDKIMLPKDYIAYRFTGEHSTDLSDASGTLLFDVEKQKWSNEMLRIVGISEEKMPRVHKGSDVIATLRSDLAEELGLSQDVLVTAGAGDNAAAAVGTGTILPGRATVSLGTSGTIFVSTGQYLPLQNHAVHQFCHTDGSYHLMGCMLSAAAANEWWLENILERDYGLDEYSRSDADKHDVYFLPYLSGERSPHNDEEIRGAFVGLSMETSAAEMSKAVLEGVSFGLRDSVEIIRDLGFSLQDFGATGGGAKSFSWLQLLSDVFSARVYTMEHEEGPGYGAAILAAVGAGVWDSVSDASTSLTRIKDVIEPDEKQSSYFNEKYKRFRELYPLLKEFYPDKH